MFDYGHGKIRTAVKCGIGHITPTELILGGCYMYALF